MKQNYEQEKPFNDFAMKRSLVIVWIIISAGLTIFFPILDGFFGSYVGLIPIGFILASMFSKNINKKRLFLLIGFGLQVFLLAMLTTSVSRGDVDTGFLILLILSVIFSFFSFIHLLIRSKSVMIIWLALAGEIIFLIPTLFLSIRNFGMYSHGYGSMLSLTLICSIIVFDKVLAYLNYRKQALFLEEIYKDPAFLDRPETSQTNYYVSQELMGTPDGRQNDHLFELRERGFAYYSDSRGSSEQYSFPNQQNVNISNGLITEKLQELERLQRQELISYDEYVRLREQILASIHKV